MHFMLQYCVLSILSYSHFQSNCERSEQLFWSHFYPPPHFVSLHILVCKFISLLLSSLRSDRIERTQLKGHGVFLLAFGPSGFRRYLIKSRAITVRKIPPAKNICKMSGGRYPMHIKLPYNQPTELAYYTTQKILMTAWKYFWQHRCEKNDKEIHQELLPKSKVFECHFLRGSWVKLWSIESTFFSHPQFLWCVQRVPNHHFVILPLQ